MRSSAFLICLFFSIGQINKTFADEVKDITAKVAMEVRPNKGIGGFSIGDLPPLEFDRNISFLTKDGVISTIICKDPLCLYMGKKIVGVLFESIEANYGDLLPVKDNDNKIKEKMYVLEEGLIICVIDGHVDHILVYKAAKE
jgi:hypothetical protein